VNAGRWGGLAGAPLGALVHLAHAWVGAFQEPVLTGAALAALLRLAAALSEVFRRDMQTLSGDMQSLSCRYCCCIESTSSSGTRLNTDHWHAVHVWAEACVVRMLPL